jgi:hypothetical protein
MSEKQPQLDNQILARLGDEHAQAQLDVAKYIESRPETAEDILHVPTPAEMVAEAPEDFTDEYIEKGYGELIEDLNSSRTRHKEKVQVIDKNGNVVHRYKMIEADPTKTDDLFDALAGKIADTKLTDDGILTVLNQMNKKLSLTDDEISTVIDKIHDAREDIQNRQDVETNNENEAEEINPFESAPELSSRRVDQKDINDANYKLEEAVANGDEKAFAEAEKFLANEVKASEMITGVKGVEAFNNMVANKRKELEENKQIKDRSLIPLDINQDKRLTDEQRKIMKDKWSEQTAPVAEPLPEIVEQTPVTPVIVPPIPPAPASSDKEKSGLKRKIVLAGLGVLAAVGLIAGANYVDDNYIDKDKTEAPSGAGDDNDGQPSADDLRDSGALDGNGSPDAETPTSAQLEAIEKAVDERTGELSDIEGSTSWSRANEAYGDNATPRLIGAVEALQADGVDAQWHGNPNTDTNAWISIDGNSETDYVWNRLAQVLGQQDVESFLTTQAELPSTD